MHFDSIVHAFRTRPAFQRLVLAFAVGLFLACAAGITENATASTDGSSASTGGAGS